MKKCAIYVVFRDGARHPLINDAAHAAGTKLGIVTRATFAVGGKAILGAKYRELLKRDVDYGLALDKTEDNQWGKPAEYRPHEPITLIDTIDMLVASWCSRLAVPPDAFEVWLTPLKGQTNGKGACIRYTRQPDPAQRFKHTITNGDVPERIASLNA